MSEKIKILGISGSLKEKSFNKFALEAAKNLVPVNVEIDILKLDGIPLFSEDIESNPNSAVINLRQKIKDSDAIVFATPEYNASITGVLKNAIDWASRPYGSNIFSKKPVAIFGVSIGMMGTIRAQSHLKQICSILDAYVLSQPEVFIGNAADKFDSNGVLVDKGTKDRIQVLLKSLTELVLTVKK
jgi:chromate reductase